MRFFLSTVALCAAVLSPVATFGHEGHHDDAANLTIIDLEASTVVISIDGDAFTYVVPEAPLSLGPITVTDSGSPVSTALAHFDNNSSIYFGPIEDISSIYVDPIEDIPSTSISSIEDISSIYVDPIEDISSISISSIEAIYNIHVGPIEAISTEWAGRSNISTDGLAANTATPSTGNNRTRGTMDPTAAGGPATPTDVTGIAIRTTPAAAAMVAFIAAGLAVLEL